MNKNPINEIKMMMKIVQEYADYNEDELYKIKENIFEFLYDKENFYFSIHARIISDNDYITIYYKDKKNGIDFYFGKLNKQGLLTENNDEESRYNLNINYERYNLFLYVIQKITTIVDYHESITSKIIIKSIYEVYFKYKLSVTFYQIENKEDFKCLIIANDAERFSGTFREKNIQYEFGLHEELSCIKYLNGVNNQRRVEISRRKVFEEELDNIFLKNLGINLLPEIKLMHSEINKLLSNIVPL